MNRLLALIRRKRVWIPLALVAAYGIFGFFVAPGILRGQIVSGIRQNLGREARLAKVRLNPFILSVTLEGFELRDSDGTPFVAFDRLYMDIQLSSLVRWALTLREFTLAGPRIHVRVMPDGQPNFLDLIPKEKGETPRLVVGRFALQHGAFRFTNLMAAEPEDVRIEPLDLELKDFTTIPNHEGLYRIAARDQGGGEWEWTGSLTTEPTHAAGTLSISGSRLTRLYEIAKSRFPVEITDGRLSCRLSYEVDVKGDSVTARLHDTSLSIAGLAVREKGVDPELLRLDSLTVRGIEVRHPQQTAAVERVLLAGTKIRAWLTPDSTLNWATVLAAAGASGNGTAPAAAPGAARAKPAATPSPAPAQGATPAKPAAAATPSQAAAPGATQTPSPVTAAPWTVTLSELAIRDLGVAFEDRTTDPTFAVEVDPVNVTVRNISSAPGARFDLATDVTIAGQGKLEVTGEVAAQPPAADLKLRLADFPLAIFQPYLNPVAKLRLVSGTLGVSGDVAFRERAPVPDVRFKGRVESRGFVTRDRIADERFLTWKGLDVESIQYSPERARVGLVRLTEPYAKFIIHRDRTTNVQDIMGATPPADTTRTSGRWDEVAEDAPADTPPPGAGRAAAGASPGASQGPGAAQAAAARDATPASGGSQATPAKAASTPAFPVRIAKVEFVNGSTDFADLSLILPFAARVEKLAGTITGISSDSASVAAVALDGTVEPSGTAQVRGEINPLAKDAYLNLGVTFRGFHMPSLTPYTGQFLGREVDKGSMSLDLQYRLEGKHLKGENKVLLDQFELGKKVESPEATKLPVGLAIAILKDSEGKIDLDLPVEGNVDDPKFRIGRVILQFIMRLLTKVATSPFALLGAVFGGSSDELSHVDFGAGASEIAADQKEPLGKLAEALSKRPQLRLEVRGRSDADADAAAIRTSKFATLAGEKLASNPKKYGGGLGYSAPLLEDLYLDRFDKDALRALRERHRVAAGTLPPDHPAYKAGSKKMIVDERSVQAAIQDTLTAMQAVGETELLALANARGHAIRQSLAQQGVDEARVFVLEPEPGRVEDGRIRVDLTLTD